MPTINMLSSADGIKGQGVGSAYIEQVNLVKEGLKNKYDIFVNSKNKCDINHFHTINPEFLIPILFDRKYFKNVGYVHFLPETIEDSIHIPKKLKSLFYKYIIEFYNNMDYLVTVNPYFINELEKYGIPNEKVTYIPNFVSNKYFYKYDCNKKYELRKKYGIEKYKFIVVGAGQIQTRKGIFDFVEVAKNIPDAMFIWAGGFSFGAITDGYKSLKKLIYNPPKNVIFTGIVERSHMNFIYNISDVFFLPSFNELFPMSVLEAMCINIPILLRDLCIYDDILFDYYLKGNTIYDFVNIINNLKNDIDYYNKWSKKSYYGNMLYSKENIIKLWEEFYDNVYNGNKNIAFN